jgi:hypothetical protein
MQHRAIRLMASKLAVAGIIEGNFTDEGLAAMSDCADMTTVLARELTQGIRNEVEDLSAVFKKMAKIKTEPSLKEIVNEATEPLSTEEVQDELFPEFLSTKVSHAAVSYVPRKKEGIQEDTFLQKLRQFNERIKSRHAEQHTA